MDSSSFTSITLSSPSSSTSSVSLPSPWESSFNTDFGSNIFNAREEDLVKSGFYRTKCYEQVICCGCGWQSDSEKLSLRHLNFLHKVSNPNCKMSAYIEGDYTNYLNYKKSIENTESMMRETFIIWPKLYPNIEDMVKTGFYYTGVEDSVSCINCGVVLDHWNLDDIPAAEHKKASPHCKLVH